MTTETALTTAKVLVSMLTDAQTGIDTFLKPFLKQYAELQQELNPSRFNKQDLETEGMTFQEAEGETFYFEGEEEYSFGDYYTPSLSLPFAFVEDPKGYSKMRRKEEAEFRARREARDAEKAKSEVERLEAALAKAREKAGL